MNRTYYFPNILRKLNIAFTSIFEGLQVAKLNDSGGIIEMRAVPVAFAHKQKFLAYMLKEKDLIYGDYLPRIGISIKGISHNPEKNRGGCLTPIYKYTNNQGATNNLFYGMPYRIDFAVSIMSLYMTEMSMILEQILPEFNPYRNITITEFDFIPDFTRDLPVGLNDIAPNFVDHFDENAQIPRVEMDLSFSMDCWLYRPLLTAEIIKTVKIDYLDINSLIETTVEALSANELDATSVYTVSGDSINDFIVTENQLDLFQ